MTPPAPSLADRLPFFVYGTLRTGQSNYNWALVGLTASEVPARLANATMFDGPGFPFVTLAPGSDTVLGDLMIIADTEYDGVVMNLDNLEGFTPGDDRNLYNRVAVTVTSNDGNRFQAWTYVVADDLLPQVSAQPKVANGDWVTHNNGRTPGSRPPAYRSAYI